MAPQTYPKMSLISVQLMGRKKNAQTISPNFNNIYILNSPDWRTVASQSLPIRRNALYIFTFPKALVVPFVEKLIVVWPANPNLEGPGFFTLCCVRRCGAIDTQGNDLDNKWASISRQITFNNAPHGRRGAGVMELIWTERLLCVWLRVWLESLNT